MHASVKNTLLATAGAAAALAGSSVVASADSITVKSGDTLYALAAAHHVTVDDLVSANKIANANLILVGQKVEIPGSAAPKSAAQSVASSVATKHVASGATYTVKAGDSLWAIANANGMTLSELLSVNDDLSASSIIYVGDTINLSASAHQVATSAAPASQAASSAAPQSVATTSTANVSAANASAAAASSAAAQSAATSAANASLAASQAAASSAAVQAAATSTANASLAASQAAASSAAAQAAATSAANASLAASQAAASSAAAQAAATSAANASAAAASSAAARPQNVSTTSTASAAATTTSTSATTTTSTTTNHVSSNTTGNTYPYGQCTWYVKGDLSWVGNYWGNASSWPASATAAGHTVNSTASVGSVAYFAPGVGGASSYGHVAVVDSVNSDGTITISEANYAGKLYNERTISTAGVQFIHQ